MPNYAADWTGQNLHWATDMSIYGGSAAPSYTLPTTILGANCVVWIDPDDNAQITQSGGTCSQIVEKANSVAFTQATSSKRPAVTANAIGSRQCFTFTAASLQWMDGVMGANIPSNNGWFVGGIMNSTTLTAFDAILACYIVGTDCSLDLDTTSNLACYVQASGNTSKGANNALSINTTYWVAMNYSPAGSGTITTYINNAQTGTNTQGSVGRTINSHIGWGGNTAWAQGWHGILGDLVVANVTATAQNMSDLYTLFAKAKYPSLP